MKFRFAAAVLAAAVTASFAAAPAISAEAAHFESRTMEVKVVKDKVQLIPDVVYSQVASRGFQNVALKMDLLVPQNKAKKPALIYVTGGGFINANRANAIQERLRIAEAGYVVASINYRVAPTSRFPQPLEDVKSAVRFLRANAARFGVDPERIGIMGGSAGGYLAAFAAATSGSKAFDAGENLGVSSAVRCAVDLYGVSDPARIGDDFSDEVKAGHRSAGATEALWVNGSVVFGGKDGGIQADPEAARKANPVAYVTEKSAPMLLMHGTADTVVSPSQSDLMYQALRSKGVDAERVLVPGAKHGGEYWVQDSVVDFIIAWLDGHLKK
jgi:acetyl esterase/lipase